MLPRAAVHKAALQASVLPLLFGRKLGFIGFWSFSGKVSNPRQHDSREAFAHASQSILYNKVKYAPISSDRMPSHADAMTVLALSQPRLMLVSM